MPDDKPPPAAPEPVQDEETGRISEKFAARVAPGGQFDDRSDTAPLPRLPPGAGGARGPDYVNPELTPLPEPPSSGTSVAAAQFLDEVAHRLARRVPTPIPDRKYAGLTSADWIKMGLGPLIAAILFLGAWYATVNRELDKRPTHEAVEKSVETGLKRHSGAIHPPAKARLDNLETEQRVIRESQIRAEEAGKAQTETLEEIRRDVRQIRRRPR